MKRFVLLSLVLTFFICTQGVLAMDRCVKLPRGIQVKRKTPVCGAVPTVILGRKFQSSFSAAFRWEDGSASGQDRSPFALNDSSSSATPYKAQRRIRKGAKDYLCYGKFLGRKGFPVPVQLTIKPSIAPRVNRYCVDFKQIK